MVVAAKLKILIVDDAPANIELLMGILANEYEVAVALDGERALKIVEKVMPSLILLDIRLPGIDGYEVCSRLRANPITAEIPVVFLTADTDRGSESKGLLSGAVDYITKPVDPDLVRLRVRTHLELKRHRDQLSSLVKARTRQLTQTLNVMLASLGTLAEYRDNETGAHIFRTRSIVNVLAKQLRAHPLWHSILTEEYIEFVTTAAPLHDIGKVGVPDHILRKPGPLTSEEFAEMKKHPTMGYQVLRAACENLEEPRLVEIAAEIAYCHHEKWDGTGYPRGLVGEQIPHSGRLMAVADVYDALVSERVYKRAMPHETAIDIIRANSETHFDPSVVEAFLQMADSIQHLYHSVSVPETT